MKTKELLFGFVLACIAGIFVISCGGKSQKPTEIAVRKDFVVGIYESTESDGSFLPVEPALIQEKVTVTKLIHREDDGDNITVPFQFKNSTEYAKITEENIDKRIVIKADGDIVSTPVVRMRIESGACSFSLPRQLADKYFTSDIIDQLLTDRK